MSEIPPSLLATIQENCDLSDARDSGIFSLCTLFLRLRNFYKWQHGLAPWEEADPGILLDWIQEREDHWQTIKDHTYQQLSLTDRQCDAFDAPMVNDYLARNHPDYLYGGGYGASMKSIFFLSRIGERRNINGIEVILLTDDLARELAAPFAMHQQNTVYFRRQPFAFFLWDRIQEGALSGKEILSYALSCYGLIDAQGKIKHQKLKAEFDTIVSQETEAVLYHEIGELMPSPLDGDTLRRIIRAYAGDLIEIVARAIKDLLADTHDFGMLGHIISSGKNSSLAWYCVMLDGMRRELFPEIACAFRNFRTTENWAAIDQARLQCRTRLMPYAVFLQQISADLDHLSPAEQKPLIDQYLLAPLGLLSADCDTQQNNSQ